MRYILSIYKFKCQFHHNATLVSDDKFTFTSASANLSHEGKTYISLYNMAISRVASVDTALGNRYCLRLWACARIPTRRASGATRRAAARRAASGADSSPPSRRGLLARYAMVMDNSVERDNNDNNATIFINNFQEEQIVTYSLVLIKGNVLSPTNENIGHYKITTTAIYKGLKSTAIWDVCNGEFKAIIDLKRGNNTIVFEYVGRIKELHLEYAPRKTNLRVTPVYIICQGHDGCFQSPAGIDNTIESACMRISIGAKLIQCITAEKLYELGLGRKTFQLEHEVNQRKEECIVFRSSLNVNKARKMKANELWSHFGREIMLSELGNNERKFLAFMSCTRFKGTDIDKSMTHEEIVSMTEGHAALGGGGLAIFGSACLYTWPTSVQEIVSKFLDNSPIDTHRFMDDSCYRGTIGGCFATTLGSVCHELGHTFDLGHTKDGIMGRGFDNIDKVFTVSPERRSNIIKDTLNNLSGKPTQHSTVALQRNISVTMNVAEPIRVLGPRSKTTLGNFASFTNPENVRRGPNVTPITRPPNVYLNMTNKMNESKRSFLLRSTNDSIYWTRNCGIFLSYHRWFNNEYGREREAITRYLKFDKNKMLILSTAGIRVVEVREESTGMVIESYEFNEIPEKRFLVPFTFSCKDKILVIVVEDDLGNVLKQVFSY